MRTYAGCVIAVMLLIAPVMRGQLPTMSDVDRSATPRAAGPLPKWDVATVKPHPPEDQMMSWQMTADSVRMVNLSLEDMICSSWDVQPYQVTGLNGWMGSSKFDLTAKVSAEDVDAYKKLNVEQRREMLQKLLMERFQLKVHMETKTAPLYNLVVDKGGSKLKETTSISAPSMEEAKAHPEKYTKGRMMMGPGRYDGTGVVVRSLVGQLEHALGKPVHDETGLTGVYDITLRYRPEDTATGGDNGKDAEAPSIFAAVQEQLGLKLVPGKGPVPMLVVDAAQKPEAD